MNKLFSTCIAGCVALLGLSSSAFSSVILTDVTTFTATGTNAAEDYIAHGYGDVNYLQGKSGKNLDYVTWQQQFSFDPAVEKIISADLTLYFHDDNDQTKNKTEHAKILFEDETGKGTPLFEGNNINGSWIDSCGVDVYMVSDGNLKITLNNQNNTGFYIDKSILSIEYNPVSSSSVPEQAVFSLFGFALLGFGLIRRKRS